MKSKAKQSKKNKLAVVRVPFFGNLYHTVECLGLGLGLGRALE